MSRAVRSTWSRWVYAAKPNSWSKLLVPMVLGQALGAYIAGAVHLGALAFGVVFVVADLLFVVFLNDWGDVAVDRLKRQMFPDGCSPKTIPDGVLARRALLLGGIAAGLVALGVAVVAERGLARPGLALAGLAALGVFWAYSLPPLRLNYRGGGEALEGFGVGLLLPWLNAYAQGGAWWNPHYALLVPFMIASLASALASGLADERSDVLGGKRTFVTLFGNAAARRTIEALLILAAAAWAVLPWWVPGVPAWGPWIGAAGTLAFVPRVLSRSAGAVTDAFAQQGRYKVELHRAIGWSAIGVAAVLALMTELR